MPFGVNSDPSFRAQKRSIRVRVSSFRTAGTVMGVSSYLFGHDLAPPPPDDGQISKRQRPVNGNAIWGGVGWGGVGCLEVAVSDLHTGTMTSSKFRRPTSTATAKVMVFHGFSLFS